MIKFKLIMKKIFNSLSLISVSSVLLFFIFLSGFFIGKENSLSDIPGGSINRVTSDATDANFEPFWKVWNLIDEKHIPASTTNMISDQEKVWGAISGLVSSYGDPYTTFFPPAENKNFETTIQGEFKKYSSTIGWNKERRQNFSNRWFYYPKNDHK